MTKNKRMTRGQSLVETALILPIIFLVLFYGITLLMLGYDRVMVGNIAQRASIDMAQIGGVTDLACSRVVSASRAASIDTNKVKTTITLLHPDALGNSAVIGKVTCDTDGHASASTVVSPGDLIQVSVTYSFDVAWFGGPRHYDVTALAEETSVSYVPAP